MNYVIAVIQPDSLEEVLEALEEEIHPSGHRIRCDGARQAEGRRGNTAATWSPATCCARSSSRSP